AMIAYGRQLAFKPASVTLELHDVVARPLPLAAAGAHLVSMSSVLHVFDEPLPTLAEIRRVLAPRGIFLLNDWVRQALSTYLAYRRDVMKESGPEALRRAFRLFPVHNKYTAEDWRWLLGEAGFEILSETELRLSHRIFLATPARRPARGGISETRSSRSPARACRRTDRPPRLPPGSPRRKRPRRARARRCSPRRPHATGARRRSSSSGSCT